MKRVISLGVILTLAIPSLFFGGCDKEKIVESTEYVHDIEYVQLPPDTIYLIDTVFNNDSVTVQNTDTVILTDTVFYTNIVHDTVPIYDTVEIAHYYYDTTIQIDTVTVAQCAPNEYLAFAALQYYSDPMVIDFINGEFGYTDGWIFYLSAFQLELTQQSSNTYDLYGYIDYWAPDWSGYYPLEFYWRLNYSGGDPADPDNWQLAEPNSSPSGHVPGVRLVPKTEQAERVIR